MKNKFLNVFLSAFLLFFVITYNDARANFGYSYYTDFFSKIQIDATKHEKDSYILFDCLYDKDAESIDAYSLFEYMREKGKKAYYITIKNSDIYNKLKENGNKKNIIVVEKYSKFDGRDFVNSIADILPKTKAIITSFGTESIIDKYFNKLSHLKYIFIQHGQIYFKESVMFSGYMNHKKFPYVLSSSEVESFIFKKYGWKDENILKSGLPRWDLLKDNKLKQNEKSIFIMFTWRATTPKRFSNSLYLKSLNSLLNNEELHRFLEENDVKIYFATHHALKNNSNINLEISHPNIEIADTKKISYYIKNSSMLLTDLSSVAFDFMFQEKPVIFYGLDRGDKGLEKYQYMDLELLKNRENIIPNIVFDENEVVERIKYYVKNNFTLNEGEKALYNKFFYKKENIREKLVSEIERICEPNIDF